MRRLAELTGENGMENSQLRRGSGSPTIRHPSRQVRGRQGHRRGIRRRGPGTKDPTQRKACGCVVSRDIGMYESCLFSCQYCYATKSFEQARVNFDSHDPKSPSLLGWHEALG